MEAKLADEIPPDGKEWQSEPKWDGFGFLAFKSGGTVDVRAQTVDGGTRKVAIV